VTWWAWLLLWGVLILASALWLYVLGRRVWRVALEVGRAAAAAQATAMDLVDAAKADRA
jgi:hypothetical protein